MAGDVKQRKVYFHDDDWEAIAAMAKDDGLDDRSVWLRQLVRREIQARRNRGAASSTTTSGAANSRP